MRSAYRFLVGIGIGMSIHSSMNLEEFLMNRVLLGGEYPTGSVAAAENTEDPDIPKASQQRLFVLGKLLYLRQ